MRVRGPWLLVGLWGCVGSIGEPAGRAGPHTPEPDPAPVCDDGPRDPGATPLRALNRREYDNTLRDLLGDDTHPASTWLADGVGLGFDNNAEAQVVTFQHAQEIVETSADVAARAVGHLRALVPCDPTADGATNCARTFIDAFARRAYRRPLDDDDRARLLAVFEAGNASDGFVTGIRLVVETVLQSPHFLYRIELGGEAAADETPGVVPLTDHEVATRLSYFLWSSMPDDALTAAADAGVLHTPEQVRVQAERMLDDPKAADAVRAFHAQWLGLDRLDTAARDPGAFPEFTDDVRAAMHEGTLAFTADVALGGGGLEELYRGDWTFANRLTAPLLGATGPSGDALERVDLDPTQRAGILTDLGVLTAHAKYDQTSPVARGVFVREQLLCEPLPNPPENVDIRLPELDPTLTTRERFAAHTQEDSCAGCHHLIDGLGFGFEGYDAIGRFRTHENGLPVDASGEIVGSHDADGTYDGAVELAGILSGSQEVRECLVTQWFRWAYGRGDDAADACTMQDLRARFPPDTPIRDLMVELTQTRTFLFRRAAAPEGCNP